MCTTTSTDVQYCITPIIAVHTVPRCQNPKCNLWDLELILLSFYVYNSKIRPENNFDNVFISKNALLKYAFLTFFLPNWWIGRIHKTLNYNKSKNYLDVIKLKVLSGIYRSQAFQYYCFLFPNKNLIWKRFNFLFFVNFGQNIHFQQKQVVFICILCLQHPIQLYSVYSF